MRPHTLVAGLFLLLAVSAAHGTITTTCSKAVPGSRLQSCTSSGPCEDFVTTKLGRQAYNFNKLGGCMPKLAVLYTTGRVLTKKSPYPFTTLKLNIKLTGLLKQALVVTAEDHTMAAVPKKALPPVYATTGMSARIGTKAPPPVIVSPGQALRILPMPSSSSANYTDEEQTVIVFFVGGPLTLKFSADSAGDPTKLYTNIEKPVFGQMLIKTVEFGYSKMVLPAKLKSLPAKVGAQAVDADVDIAAKVCGKQNTIRGFPLPAMSCPAGEEYGLGLCYDTCKKGYGGFGLSCVEDCVDGTDFGIGCRRPAEVYNKGCCCIDVPLIGWKNGCCNNCNPGFDDKGCECRRPGTEFFKKSYLRGPKGFPDCKNDNKDYQAGMCFPQCPAGQSGFLSWCFQNACPAEKPYDCTFFCAKDRAGCSIALDAVQVGLKATGESIDPCIGAVEKAFAGEFSADWFTCASKVWKILTDVNMALFGFPTCGEKGATPSPKKAAPSPPSPKKAAPSPPKQQPPAEDPSPPAEDPYDPYAY